MTYWWISLLASACCFAQWSGPPFPPESAQLKPADLKEILGLLCPGREYIGQESGCHVCPQQTTNAGNQTDSTIESAILGHFVDAKSDDMLLVLYGCSPHAGDFRDAFLFTHSTTGWFVSQASELPVGRCRKIQNREGRDSLVCFTDHMMSGESTARLVFSYLPRQSSVELAAAFDNTGMACEDPRRMVVQSAIQQVSFLPGTGGKLTLRILARCRRGPLSARSRKACAAGPGFEDIGPALPFRAFRIDYNFNGETFSLAPVSRASKQAYEACSSEGK